MCLVAKEEDKVYQEVDELQKRLDTSNNELTELEAELSRTTSELEEEGARLKSLNVEYIVAEKEIEEIQNAIFMVKGKRSETDDNVYDLQQELERKEAELDGLADKKRNLAKSIAEVEADIRHDADMFNVFEKEMREISSAVEKREAGHAELSQWISEKLANTSLERDEIESKLADLNVVFVSRIDERDRVKKSFIEREEVISRLRKESELLEERCSLFEELESLLNKRIALKGDIESLEQEARSVESKVRERNELLDEKEEELNGLSTEDAARIDSIASLDKEVGVYDELVLKAKDSKERFGESDTLSKQAIPELERLLADNRRLESELRLLNEEASKIVKTMDDMG